MDWNKEIWGVGIGGRRKDEGVFGVMNLQIWYEHIRTRYRLLGYEQKLKFVLAQNNIKSLGSCRGKELFCQIQVLSIAIFP